MGEAVSTASLTVEDIGEKFPDSKSELRQAEPNSFIMLFPSRLPIPNTVLYKVYICRLIPRAESAYIPWSLGKKSVFYNINNLIHLNSLF